MDSVISYFIQFYHHFVKRASLPSTVLKPPLKIGLPKYTR